MADTALRTRLSIVYVDCLVVKVRENQRVINKALYLVLGVDVRGQKELLGRWLAQHHQEVDYADS